MFPRFVGSEDNRININRELKKNLIQGFGRGPWDEAKQSSNLSSITTNLSGAGLKFKHTLCSRPCSPSPAASPPLLSTNYLLHIPDQNCTDSSNDRDTQRTSSAHNLLVCHMDVIATVYGDSHACCHTLSSHLKSSRRHS